MTALVCLRRVKQREQVGLSSWCALLLRQPVPASPSPCMACRQGSTSCRNSASCTHSLGQPSLCQAAKPRGLCIWVSSWASSRDLPRVSFQPAHLTGGRLSYNCRGPGRSGREKLAARFGRIHLENMQQRGLVVVTCICMLAGNIGCVWFRAVRFVVHTLIVQSYILTLTLAGTVGCQQSVHGPIAASTSCLANR